MTNDNPQWQIHRDPGSVAYMVKSADETMAVAGTFHRSMACELAFRLNTGKPIPLTVLTLNYGRA